MRRLAFFFFISAALTVSLAASPDPSATVIAIKRSFQLEVLPDEFVQHLTGSDGLLYFVTHNRSTGISSLGIARSDGARLRSRHLPPDARFAAMGIGAAGEVLLPAFRRGGGQEIHTADRDGNPLAIRYLGNPVGVLAYCVTGDKLYMYTFRSDSSISAINLDTGDRREYESVLPGGEFVALHSISSTRILAIDEITGRVGTLDVKTGVTHVTQLDSPEISSARIYLAQQTTRQAAIAKGNNRVSAPLVIASYFGGESLYCLIAPIDRSRGALLIRASERGTIQGKHYLAMPERKIERRIPAKLVLVYRELFTVYADGYVAVYEIP